MKILETMSSQVRSKSSRSLRENHGADIFYIRAMLSHMIILEFTIASRGTRQYR